VSASPIAVAGLIDVTSLALRRTKAGLVSHRFPLKDLRRGRAHAAARTGPIQTRDSVGAFIPDLHDDVARATIAQVMSHSAGLTRDGEAGNQFSGLRPFVDQAEVLADLTKLPSATPASNTRTMVSPCSVL
jgi:hypothetical protein